VLKITEKYEDFLLVDFSPPAKPEVIREGNMFPFQNSHSGDKMHKLKSSQKSICREFITLTQTGEKTALYCLSQHDWKLEVALDNYFANPEVSFFFFLQSNLELFNDSFSLCSFTIGNLAVLWTVKNWRVSTADTKTQMNRIRLAWRESSDF